LIPYTQIIRGKKNMSRKNLITECIGVTFAFFVFIFILQTHPFSGVPGRIGGYLTPLAWILVPWIILTIRQESFMEFGYHLEDFPRSLGMGLVVSLLLIPYFTVFALRFGMPDLDFLEGGRGMDWIRMALYQAFYIALPEEFFFRGYLQTRLNQIFGKPCRLLGAETGWGLFLASLIFMIFHLVIGLNVWNAAIFVPALIFGWLREKTGSITASTVFHAMCNIMLFTFQGRTS